jgi:hypothetical protein
MSQTRQNIQSVRGALKISGPILPTPDLLGSGCHLSCDLQHSSEHNCRFMGLREVVLRPGWTYTACSMSRTNLNKEFLCSIDDWSTYNIYTWIISGVKSGQRVGLTTLPPSMSRISENVGASTSRNPKGLHGLYGDNFTLVCNTVWSFENQPKFRRNMSPLSSGWKNKPSW